MVGTLIFGPTSLHGLSHNVATATCSLANKNLWIVRRIDYHEFFFLHLRHGRDRRGADDLIPGEMVRRS